MMITSKQFLASLAVLIVLCSSSAGAQYGANPRYPYQPAADPAAAQRLLDSITPVAGARRVDEGTIIRIQALGLRTSPGNVAKVQQLLAADGSTETTSFLINLLGSLYVPNFQAPGNAEIRRTLRSYIFGNEKRLATTALLTYSRTGIHPDRIATLDYGFSHGLLDENSYCQELALGFQISPATAQRAAAIRLAERNNAFGARVLASGFGREGIAEVAPDVRLILLSFFKKNEPAMPMAIGELGFEGDRYADWLEVVALLSEASGQGASGSFIFNTLSRPDTDPRKVLTYLSSEHGVRFIKTAASRKALAPITDPALLLSSQFPGHPVFTPMAEQIKQTLATLRD